MLPCAAAPPVNDPTRNDGFDIQSPEELLVAPVGHIATHLLLNTSCPAGHRCDAGSRDDGNSGTIGCTVDNDVEIVIYNIYNI